MYKTLCQVLHGTQKRNKKANEGEETKEERREEKKEDRQEKKENRRKMCTWRHMQKGNELKRGEEKGKEECLFRDWAHRYSSFIEFIEHISAARSISPLIL